MKTFDEFLNEAKEKLPKIVAASLLAGSIEQTAFDLTDDGESMSARAYCGSMKSGSNKGKFKIFVVSNDAGESFASRSHFASKDDALKIMPKDSISREQLIKNFTKA